MRIMSIILIILVIRDYKLLFNKFKKFPIKLMLKMLLKAHATKDLRFQILGDTLLLIFMIAWWVEKWL